MRYRKTLDWKDTLVATTAVVNPDSSRYLRIAWVNDRPQDWKNLSATQYFIRRCIINDNLDYQAVWVDNSIICLS